MEHGLNKLIGVLMLTLTSIACSQPDTIGYYEPDGQVMDETIYRSFGKGNYHLVREGFTPDQLKAINEIVENKSLHLPSELGTCEISGVLVLAGKTIYLTCGTAQLFVSGKEGVEKIMLNESGNHQLFNLVRDLRK